MAPREQNRMNNVDSDANGSPPHGNSNRKDVDVGQVDDDDDCSSPILVASRHLLQSNGGINGDDVAAVILPLFPTLWSAIPTTNNGHRPALSSLDGRQSISHARIIDFGQNEFGPFLATSVWPVVNRHNHPQPNNNRRTPMRIALILPNGPELAVAIVVTAQYGTAIPLNANAPRTEWMADLQQCGADLVIGLSYNETTTGGEHTHHPSDGSSAFRSVHEVANQLGLPYCGLVPSAEEAGIFRLVPYFTTPLPTTPHTLLLQPNGPDDTALVLFTSGTTGQKKLVPHVVADLITAAVTIALSWQLRSSDVNLNMMPLFHIGGIVRQVFAPLISGGAVICCPAFDPTIFWTLLETKSFTWYYAAPTMHQLILQTGKADGYICDAQKTGQYSLRMIANAAGGLLPSLAEELKRTFQTNVRFGLAIFFLCLLFATLEYHHRAQPNTSHIFTGCFLFFSPDNKTKRRCCPRTV
jgi:hypothetical protein